MTTRRFLLAAAASFIFAVPLAGAQNLAIRPAIVDSSEPVERALAENKGRASTALEGKGATLVISYHSNQPLEIYMVPLEKNDLFVPTDFLRFTLPQTEDGTASIDLTVSPGWKPIQQKWLVHLLSKDEKADAGFNSISFTPSSPFRIAGAGVGHFLTAEPYTPSSYHALRGYRIFGAHVAVMLGIATVLIAFVCLLFVKRERMLMTGVTILLTGTALYQLRFGIDLLRFTNEHLTEYAGGTYDEAGSAHLVAAAIKLIGKEGQTVYSCRDGTNYKEKILRYFAYPIRISSDDADAAKADFAVVMDKQSWNLDTATVNKATVLTLRCGAANRRAERLNTFADGSILFRLLP